MAKLNTLSLLDPGAPQFTETFRDPLQPGKAIALTVKRREHADLALAAMRAQELIEERVTGRNGRPPLPWPPHVPGQPKPRPIRFSEAFCWELAYGEVLQCPADPNDVYDAEDLAVISQRMPNAWPKMVTWINEVTALAEPEEGDPGNVSAACEETSSPPPVTGDAPTPPSITTPVRRSGASTNGLDGSVRGVVLPKTGVPGGPPLPVA